MYFIRIDLFCLYSSQEFVCAFFIGVQEVDYGRYPDKDRQLVLLRVYMEQLGKLRRM